MANVTFDKKQLPQVAALGTLSACMFGYFGFKMIAPPATNAAPAGPGTPTAGAAAMPGTSTSAAESASSSNTGTAGGVEAVDPSALIGAAAPSAAMRDPFSAPSAAKAGDGTGDSAPHGLPSLAALAAPSGHAKDSGASGIQPLPGAAAPAPAAPPTVISPASQWGVSGVICSDINPSLSLAIFRAGNIRRYVRVGEWLDNATQLVSLDRTGVELVRSGMRFRLTIGASPDAAPVQRPSATPSLTPSPLPQQTTLPQQHAELLPQPAQASPVVTVASATQPEQETQQGQRESSPIEKVAASVQVTPCTVPGLMPPTIQAAQPTDASSSATGAMDVPAFNSDLPAASDAGQLKPAPWTSQAGVPPTGSVLLAPDQNQAATAGAALPSPGFARVAAAPQTNGFGMTLVSTPSSVLQALGIDTALFAPQAAVTAPAVPALDTFGNTADAPNGSAPSETASVFEQYDDATSADMAQIACIGDLSQALAAQDAPATADDTDTDPLDAWSAGVQQTIQRLSQEFTS